MDFRNVLVHEYTELDWKIVMRVIRTDTRDLAAFSKAVLRMLENRS
ncbi:MAG: HepT-like ribonuclease domain-containing protein [Pseudomonadota bacterium]